MRRSRGGGGGGGGGQGVRTPPEKSGLLAILARIPLKSQSYHASIQCWTTMGRPLKHH